MFILLQKLGHAIGVLVKVESLLLLHECISVTMCMPSPLYNGVASPICCGIKFFSLRQC